MKHSFYLSAFFLAALMTSASALAAEATPKSSEWKADLRFRHEMIQAENATPSAYHQQRIRARLGFTGMPNENTELEFRLTSGIGRLTANQTLGQTSVGGVGNAFNNYYIAIDRAYFNLHPVTGMSFLGGRMKNLYFMPGGSDLIWNSELNFDGMALNYKYTLADFTPFITSSFYWIDKVTSGSNKDVWLSTLQTGVKHKVMEELQWSVGAAYHFYKGMAGHAALAPSYSLGATGYGAGYNAAGNSNTGANRAYTADFHLVELGAEVTNTFIGPQIAMFFNWVNNRAVDTEGTGYLFGARFGSTGKPGDWSVSYDYRKLERNAAVGAFSEPNSWGGGTNGKGHRIAAAYTLMTNTTLVASYLNGRANISEPTALKRNRVQFDLVFGI